MSKPKVSYFDLPAMGEPIRLLLAYGGEDFENDVVSMDRWKDMKNTTPFGVLPIYEENGKVVGQSIAIMRYLAKKCKLHSEDPWECLEIDAMAETLRDLIIKIALCHYETSASSKQKKTETLIKETLPFYLEKLGNIVKENGGFLAVKRFTWVDILFASTVKYASLMAKIDLLKSCPNLNVVYENVMKVPAIQKYYEKHPLSFANTTAWLESTGKPSQP